MPTLVARLDDPADDVALAAFVALCDIRDPGTDLVAAHAKLTEREAFKFNDDLRRALDRTFDTQTLRDSIDWLNIGTASAYQVLAEERWDEFRDTVRRDLGDRFKTFAEESRARVRRGYTPEVIQALESGGTALVTAGEGALQEIDPKLIQQFRDFLGRRPSSSPPGIRARER